jgi:hypothetical protein
VSDDEIFEAIPSLLTAGLAQTPRPCGCARHAATGREGI